tara:strand:+ start:4045 stop:5682 length:1638 start_codon:yes stop_codon:yes gene_type:complete
MRFLLLNITFLFFVLTASVEAQNRNEKDSLQKFIYNITNTDVKEAKDWHHNKLTEKSLKKGLEILSSNQTLTQVDSFHTYQILAYNFSRIGTHTPALEHAKIAVEIMGRIDPGNTSRASWISSYYSAVGQYSSAIAYMKQEAIILTQKSDSLRLLKQFNNIGYTFYLNNQIDSAVMYYNKVIQFKNNEEKYKGIIGLTTGNLGAINFMNGDYKNAIINMEIDAKLNKDRDKGSYYNAMNGIGECYFLIEKFNKAEATLIKLVKQNHTDSKVNLKTYRLLADVYQKMNRSSSSALYLRKYINLKDSIQKNEITSETIFKQLSDSKINGIKKDLELAKNKFDLMDSELMLSKNRAKAQKLKTQIYLITLVLSIIMILISVVYYKNRQRKNIEIHRLERELISAELNSKKKDLNNVVTNLSYKRKFIDEVQNKLKELQQNRDEQLGENVTLLMREFTNYKNADKNVEVLQADIDRVNLSFFNKLGEKFPLLTENEKELCGLFILKLSSKDIAILRNVTPNAIKKARQRIRRKLPITESEKITKFLDQL